MSAAAATLDEALDALGPEDTPAPDATPAPGRRRVRPPRDRTAERARAKEKAAAGRKSMTLPQLRAGMAQLYTMTGVGVAMLPHPGARGVGLACTAQAEACAEAWESLARENARVRAALEQLLTVSSVGVLLAAHAPILLAAAQASARGQSLLAQMAAGAAGAPAP